MLDLILPALIVSVSTLVGFLYMKRSIPKIIQNVLDDIGPQIGEQISRVFAEPAVSKAMGVLGKRSGEVRADKALRQKASDAIVTQIPSLGFVLDQLGMSAEEGIRLMNDPLFGPVIQGFLAKGLKGLSNMGKGGSLLGTPSNSGENNSGFGGL